MAKKAEKYEIRVSSGTELQLRALASRTKLPVVDLVDIVCTCIRAGMDRALERDVWLVDVTIGTPKKDEAGIAIPVSPEAHAVLSAVAALGGISAGDVFETALARGGYRSLQGLDRIEPMNWAGFSKHI